VEAAPGEEGGGAAAVGGDGVEPQPAPGDMEDGATLPPPGVKVTIPSAAAVTSSILASNSKRKQVLKAAGEVEISEKIRGHLNAIATAMVDDMTSGIRKEVAKDPRIQARCIKPRRQLEKEIIREYQQQMSEKRKDSLNMSNFAATLALSGLSTKAYCAIRAAIQRMGGRGMLPSLEAVREARKQLEALAVEDLGVYPTPDGWFISARAAVEMEISRIMQVIDPCKSTVTRMGPRTSGIMPDGHGWQDRFHVKITLDARRITRRTSQTEVMLIIIPKGQEGVDRCQKAVFQRTIGIWTGKDSRDNVQANMERFYQEVESLETEGVVFCPKADSLLGIWEEISKPEKALTEASPAWAERGLRRVGLRFWHAGDMASQCAVLGHGCAGDHYCGHCMAHKEERHIPYALVRVPKAISFQKLASEYDMFPRTLREINLGSQGKFGLTETGLRSCTANASFEDSDSEAEEEAEPGSAPVQPAATGLRGRGPAARGAPKARKVVKGVCLGPDVNVLRGLTEWKQGHAELCRSGCASCTVPAGTVVRVIPRNVDYRESEWLKKHWPSHSQKRFPFCVLHCLMRVTEAMFMMITQRCLKNDKVIRRLNDGLTEAGIAKQFTKIAGASGVHTYEKLTFEGHQALRLLAKDGGTGKMWVASILESMWPSKSGDAEGEGGRQYVPRSVALWEQWAKVVEIMIQRDPAKVRSNVDASGMDGFARFGKECREFCHQYQAMFHEQHCRSFYLHTLLHHAGDFMRELEQDGMCLGMMSNSGAERRHEYGRRAAKKAVAGGCWKAKVPGLAEKENVLAYLTLKEILIWQHGTDLVSHELALRKAAGADGGARRGVRSRRAVNEERLSAAANAAADADAKEEVEEEEEEKLRLEEEQALEEVAEIAVVLESTPELVEVEFEGEVSGEGGEKPVGVRNGRDGHAKYVIEEDPALFRGRDKHWDVLEQESAAGSEDFEDEDAEEMEQRIKDLDDRRGDWLPQGVAAAPGPVPTATKPAPKYTESGLKKKSVHQLAELCMVGGIFGVGGNKKQAYIDALLAL